MVQIWYPAEYAKTEGPAPYVLSPGLYTQETQQKWIAITEGAVTGSVLNAKPAAGAPFPVVIYNPGAGNPHFTGTYQTEFLASHGYVVVAIGHTGLTGIARFPDGTAYTPRPDAPGFMLPPGQTRGLNAVEQYEAREQNAYVNVMPLQLGDISFVLDQLSGLNAQKGGRFYGRLDLERVASLGFSLGGALSLQAARDEPRVKAAVNLDGWLYTDVSRTGLNKPVLILHGVSPSDPVPPERRELNLIAESRFWRMLRQTRADWFDVTITGAVHRYFSDRTLFSPPEAQYLPPRRVHQITNLYVLEFFDHYLKGAPLGPLLSGQEKLPETSLIRNSTKTGEDQ